VVARPHDTAGDHRRRLVLHHLPLALASAVALIAFMTLPPFATDLNRGGVDLSSGSLPQRRSERPPAAHGPDQAQPTDHPAMRAEPTPTPHGRAPARPGEHAGTGHQAQPSDYPQPSAQPGTHSGGQLGGSDGGTTMPTTSDRSLIQRFTVASGYVATGLLAVTLLIGPANVLLRRRNPVSSYLRRDAGAWTAIFSVVHVIAGLQVHGQLSAFVSYFLASDGTPLTNSFGLGNWTGLAATVIVFGLLALSSDYALRRLKAGRWKRLQRLNYALFAFVVAHAFFYGALLRTTSPFTLLLLVAVGVVVVVQLIGIWLWQQRHALARTVSGN
jgi:sulfoxide reductase heme-binding subunit YedZ